MRILYIHTKYLQSAGGEDTTLDAEVELMKSKGHEVLIQHFQNAGTPEGFLNKIRAGIDAVYNVASARIVRKVILDFKPDILHVHNFFFAASPSVLIEAQKHRIPVVVTLHNFRLICANCLLLRDNKVCELCVKHDFPWYGVKYKCYHQSALQSAVVGSIAAIHKWMGTWQNKVDLFFTPSAFMRKRLLDSSLRVASERMNVKPNFIADPGTGDVHNRKSFYLFVGRLSAEKGLNSLLDAWQWLPDQQLVVLGDGPEKEQYLLKAKNLPNVEFLGVRSREEVISRMKTCRALIFPSVWYEGLPLTIIEALATGTPVLASATGAMAEMIIEGENGLLFEPGNSKAISEKIIAFEIQHRALDFSMYKNARTRYLENYHPEKCYDLTMKYYTGLINDHTHKKR